MKPEKNERKALTSARLEKLPPPKAGRTEIVDLGCRGLYFRLTKNGVASWSYRYSNPQGGISRVTIGTYPTIGLSKARQLADDLRRGRANGEDPIAIRRQQKIEAQTKSKTFGTLAARYLEEHARRHKRSSSADEDERNLTKHILPYWAERRYADIARADVIEVIERIARRHPIAANRVASLVSKVFSFAIDVGLMPTSPAIRLKKPGKEVVKERTLDDDEVRLFWNRIVQSPCSLRTGLALRLALTTGLRRGEIAELRRDELQRFNNADAIYLSAERTKSKRKFFCPLSPLAKDIVNEALKMSDDDFVFSGQIGGLAVEPHSLTTAMRRFGENLEGDDPGIESWKDKKKGVPTPHALRRTVATRLGQLNIDERLIERVMNHAPRGVTARHYNHHDYFDQKKKALDAWARMLQAILDGKSANIVQWRTKRS